MVKNTGLTDKSEDKTHNFNTEGIYRPNLQQQLRIELKI